MASDSNQVSAEALVTEAIRALGVDPSEVRAGDSRRWVLRRGSATVVVDISDSSGGWLRVIAPVVKLPADEQLAALSKALLSANATELSPGMSFGVLDDDVLLVAARSTAGLDAAAVDAIIKGVGSAADHWDDQLAEQFGTQRSSDS